MDNLLAPIKELIDGKIDFAGQKRAEQLTQQILIFTGIFSFLIGFILQSLKITLILYSLGLTAALLAIVPPWKHFNRHPVNWLKEISDNEATSSLNADLDETRKDR